MVRFGCRFGGCSHPREGGQIGLARPCLRMLLKPDFQTAPLPRSIIHADGMRECLSTSNFRLAGHPTSTAVQQKMLL
jgi:hypothetical protein